MCADAVDWEARKASSL